MLLLLGDCIGGVVRLGIKVDICEEVVGRRIVPGRLVGNFVGQTVCSRLFLAGEMFPFVASFSLETSGLQNL